MNLADLRAEVMNHGFDANLFGIDRITNYVNNAMFEVVRRVDYYVDESSMDFSTVSGTARYNLPADFARARSLRDTTRNVEMQSVLLREIDRSSASSGPPSYYAFDGQTLHLWPTPDGVYPLEFRYWNLPAPLAADADVPPLPSDYHPMLWMGAVAECYAAEDDPQTAQYWSQRFQQQLGRFAVDQKFPSTDAPSQARSMWGEESGLIGPGSWTFSGG